jgi:hypothetical protein
MKLVHAAALAALALAVISPAVAAPKDVFEVRMKLTDRTQSSVITTFGLSTPNGVKEGSSLKTSHAYVKAITAKAGADGKPVYEITPGEVTSGVSFDVRPHLVSGKMVLDYGLDISEIDIDELKTHAGTIQHPRKTAGFRMRDKHLMKKSGDGSWEHVAYLKDQLGNRYRIKFDVTRKAAH